MFSVPGFIADFFIWKLLRDFYLRIASIMKQLDSRKEKTILCSCFYWFIADNVPLVSIEFKNQKGKKSQFREVSEWKQHFMPVIAKHFCHGENLIYCETWKEKTVANVQVNGTHIILLLALQMIEINYMQDGLRGMIEIEKKIVNSIHDPYFSEV